MDSVISRTSAPGTALTFAVWVVFYIELGKIKRNLLNRNAALGWSPIMYTDQKTFDGAGAASYERYSPREVRRSACFSVGSPLCHGEKTFMCRSE
ncbi:hypothetical protein IQ06DRAFT_146113 [Phaeosphaeriaceae sp. SRC1lsM3a]|nr:hypothetical protein IQ06DRAFT_146113 [Stagonospora sp. SRC1lsM3a]